MVCTPGTYTSSLSRGPLSVAADGRFVEPNGSAVLYPRIINNIHSLFTCTHYHARTFVSCLCNHIVCNLHVHGNYSLRRVPLSRSRRHHPYGHLLKSPEARHRKRLFFVFSSQRPLFSRGKRNGLQNTRFHVSTTRVIVMYLFKCSYVRCRD